MSTPDTPLYGAAKHGVLGLFRALRAKPLFAQYDRTKTSDGNSKPREIQINVHMLAPYFTETPIISPPEGRYLPADLELTDINDVVEAASRMITTVGKEGNGKALAVGTKRMAQKLSGGVAGKRNGIWELKGLQSKL